MNTKNKFIIGLIVTFLILYICVAFVSTLHAITFFNIGNVTALSILLAIAFEIGQSSILFSLLLTENKNRLLSWFMMFLLTAVQISANVYATFKHIELSGSNDWTFWQRSILFFVQAETPEMYKIIIAWIQGSILPIVALGLTALVVDNMNHTNEEKQKEQENKEIINTPTLEYEKVEQTVSEPLQYSPAIQLKDSVWTSDKIVDKIEPEQFDEDDLVVEQPKEIIKGQELIDNLNNIIERKLTSPTASKPIEEEIKTQNDVFTKDDIIEANNQLGDFLDNITEQSKPTEKLIEAVKDYEGQTKKMKTEKKTKKLDVKPVNKIQGWHLLKEFVDNEHNVFSKGKFLNNDPSKEPTIKKA